MHKEILTKTQVQLLFLIKKFSDSFGLVGGTAFALYLGHRRSIDFDLFSFKEFDNLNIKRKISCFTKISEVLVNRKGEYTILIGDVKLTFFHYPFKINFLTDFNRIIKLPDLLTLAAMKAYALGQRAKWKDYVDLYFVMKKYYGLNQIVKKAKQIFFSEFNEKLFRAQLVYFKDIDYSEKVIYMKNFETEDRVIRKALKDFSLNIPISK